MPIINLIETIEQVEARLAVLTNPREKLGLLIDTGQALQRANPALGRECVERALVLAETIRDKRGIARSLELASAYMISTEPVEAVIRHLERCRESYRAVRDRAAVVRVDYLIAMLMMRLGEHEKAIETATRCMKFFDRSGDRHSVAKALNTIGLARKELTQYAPAIEALRGAAAIWEELDDSFNLGRCYNNLGLVYGRIEDYDQAEHYFQQSLIIRRALPDPYGEAMTLNNLGGVMVKRNRPLDGLGHLLRANEIYRSLGLSDREMASWNTMGRAHHELGDYRTALGCFRTGLAIGQRIGHDRLDPYIYCNIGRCYNAQGYHSTAIRYLRKALRVARAGRHVELECELCELLADAYRRAGDAAAAYDFHVEYTRMHEALLGRQTQRDVAKVEVRMELERIRKERHSEKAYLESLRQEVETRSREVTAMTLQLLQRNELITRLNAHIRKLEGEGLSDSIEALRSLCAGLSSTDDWSVVSARFYSGSDHVHSSIARQFPMLTPTELKVCTLLKANLSSKDIASLLCIAVRTVEIHRGNIRKKMGVPSSMSLSMFLAGI